MPDGSTKSLTALEFMEASFAHHLGAGTPRDTLAVMRQLWVSKKLDTWSTLQAFDAKTGGEDDISLQFLQTLYDDDTVHARLAHNDNDLEMETWLITEVVALGIYLHVGTARHLQALGPLSALQVQPIPLYRPTDDPWYSHAALLALDLVTGLAGPTFQKEILQFEPEVRAFFERHQQGPAATPSDPPAHTGDTAVEAAPSLELSTPSSAVGAPTPDEDPSTQIANIPEATSMAPAEPQELTSPPTVSFQTPGLPPKTQLRYSPVPTNQLPADADPWDLLFPDHPPPGCKTHHDGRYVLDSYNRRVWCDYEAPLPVQDLPSNTPSFTAQPSHWIGRVLPDNGFLTSDGSKVYLNHSSPQPASQLNTSRRYFVGNTIVSPKSSSRAPNPPSPFLVQHPVASLGSNPNHPRQPPPWTPPNPGSTGPPGHGPPHGNPHGSGGFGGGRGSGPPGGGGSGPPSGPGGGGGGGPSGPPGGGGGGGPPDGGGGNGGGNPFPFLAPKPWTVKPDASSYKKLRNNADFPRWYDSTIALLRAHGVSELADPTYTPLSAMATRDFASKQAWFYAVLLEVVQTATGKAIVRAYKDTYDARRVLYELKADADVSVAGHLATRQLRQTIQTIRLDSTWKGTQLEFLLHFMDLCMIYDDKQEYDDLRFTEVQKKVYLETAVAPATNLELVTQRETENMIAQGLPPHTFLQYFRCLEAAAQLYDTKNAPASRRRQAFLAEQGFDDPDAMVPSQDDVTFDVFQAQSQDRTPRPRLSPDLWNKLSKSAQQTWRNLNDTDKATFVDALHPSLSNPVPPGATRSAHVATITDTDAADTPDRPDSPHVSFAINHTTTSPPAEVTPPPATARAPTSAASIGDAHPGDPRRLLSVKAKSSPASSTRKVNAVSFLPKDPSSSLEHYWNSERTNSIEQYWQHEDHFYDAHQDFP